jgi:large subunit ribosomal protein L20
MTRIKRGVAAHKRRKNVIADAKGFRWRRKTNFRAAKEALLKAGSYAFRDRRAKKRTFRALWITRLNNALRLHGMKYSQFIALEKEKGITLDRKVLSQLAITHPETFKAFVEKVK